MSVCVYCHVKFITCRALNQYAPCAAGALLKSMNRFVQLLVTSPAVSPHSAPRAGHKSLLVQIPFSKIFTA